MKARRAQQESGNKPGIRKGAIAVVGNGLIRFKEPNNQEGTLEDKLSFLALANSNHANTNQSVLPGQEEKLPTPTGENMKKQDFDKIVDVLELLLDMEKRTKIFSNLLVGEEEEKQTKLKNVNEV